MIFDHPVCSNPTKSATKYIILWKVIITSFKISNWFYLVIFHKKKTPQSTKYGDQNVNFFDVRYNFYTPCIFTFILAYMTSMEFKLSNDIQLYGC